MKATNTYLMFDGECKEAMEFYAGALGGELYTMPYSEAPDAPKGSEERTIHARVSGRFGAIMASDVPADMRVEKGDNFYINIACESREELDKVFDALKEGGVVRQAPHDAFWGAYFGMLTDKYGVGWMFNYETAPKA
jgi:PhnB protein